MTGLDVRSRGVVGRGRGGRRPPLFSKGGGGRVPTPPTFWSEIRAKVQYSRINIDLLQTLKHE